MTGGRFDGAVAVVTGGRGDIGRAIATALAAEGAQVSVADRRPVPSESETGVTHAVLDVSDAVAVAGWLDEVEHALGVPTIVIPAAATATPVGLLAMSPEEWRAELDADLTAPYLVARDAARRMVAADRPGRVVLIGSWAAHAPHPHVGAYSVAKAGLRMLTRVLAADLARHGILVNEIAIGVVDAGVSRDTFARHPELKAQAQRQSPLGRLVGIDEITAQVLALADPALASMTGSTVVLDAGVSLRTALSSEEHAR